MIIIDGAFGEGGGQIVRSALSLSMLTGQAVRIEAIRAGRSKSGLQAQHLTAVRAAAVVCRASLRGDALGSMTLEFVPQTCEISQDYDFDVAEARHGSSAGSVTLVFQTVFLPLALVGGPSRLIIHGGTHVPWSPPVPYLRHVFLPAVWQMGLRAEVTLNRYGWYPAGGGEAEFKISTTSQSPLSTLQLTQRGELRKVWGVAAVSNLPSHIAQRMASRAANILKAGGLRPDKLEAAHVEATGPGVGIFIFAEYEHIAAGFCAYGRKGLPAEKVAEEACDELLAHHHSGAAVDPHLADQLMLPAALARAPSQWTTSRVTRHLLTNAWVARQFVECKIDITGEEGLPGRVIVTPAGE